MESSAKQVPNHDFQNLTIEVYLYDEKVAYVNQKNGTYADNTIIFHYPKVLAPEHVSLNAGQLVVLYKSTKRLLKCSDDYNERGEIRTSKGHCEFWPLGQRFLLLVLVKFPHLQNKSESTVSYSNVLS